MWRAGLATVVVDADYGGKQCGEGSWPMRARVKAIAALVGLFSALQAPAHHSNSAYQVDQIVTLTGTVKEWRWANPHTWLVMAVEGEDGNVVEWAVEGRPPGILGRAGWHRTSLVPGERVTVHASPAKNGDPEGIIARVTKADGTVLGNQPNFNRTAAAALPAPAAAPAPAPAAGDRPNFAGVYYPAQQIGQAAPAGSRPNEPLPPPTRSSPTADGSQGRVDFMCIGITSGLPFVKSGRLIPLAVNTTKRSPRMPRRSWTYLMGCCAMRGSLPRRAAAVRSSTSIRCRFRPSSTPSGDSRSPRGSSPQPAATTMLCLRRFRQTSTR